MSKPAVAVTPKPGTKFYHGHGHHHFEAGRSILLPADDAERLIKDGLVELASDGEPSSEQAQGG